MTQVKHNTLKTPWPSGTDKIQWIQNLLDRKQPFALVKSKTRFLDIENWEYCIALLQTYDNAEDALKLSLEKEEFKELIREFNFVQLFRSEYGYIYGHDNRLRDLKRELNSQVSQIDDWIGFFEDEAEDKNLNEAEKIIAWKTKAFIVQKRTEMKDAIEEAFYKQNKIIVWGLYTPKDNDED